jgi:hypothetical protein
MKYSSSKIENAHENYHFGKYNKKNKGNPNLRFATISLYINPSNLKTSPIEHNSIYVFFSPDSRY